MWKRTLALALCLAQLASGCAAAAGPRRARVPAPAQDTAMLADYVQRLAAGSLVRVERADGGSMRGILIKATPQAIVIQRNSRVPEPPVEIAVADLARVTLDMGGMSTAKAIGIGVASGLGAFLAIVGIIAATLND
jgi:hypothetical protein